MVLFNFTADKSERLNSVCSKSEALHKSTNYVVEVILAAHTTDGTLVQRLAAMNL